ncbi:hypothetical protein EVA_07826 [gut metagenome]|uniref:Uncharacterized protein n=1 Tax=gut metagenome TaxID=749906 RepID=J9GUH0_9ZZZZ
MSWPLVSAVFAKYSTIPFTIVGLRQQLISSTTTVLPCLQA